jgi:SAM-dependent methyltransferase
VVTEVISMTSQRSVNEEVKTSWNANAQFWDQQMGEDGNRWQRLLIDPATERLLDLQSNEMVLEIACGSGRYARIMAHAGARVVATDFAPSMLEIAKSRNTRYQAQIEFQLLDATDRIALMSLGKKRFDAALCYMAMFDMVEIEPLIETLRDLLKENGRFVFSLLHPCFNSAYTKRGREVWEDREGTEQSEHFIKILSYNTPLISKGNAISGQPVPQYYFHRTISTYLNICFQAGFVLDGMEEPTFGATGEPDFTDNIYRDIPPVLVARMRKCK